jgi:hypothetical protein
MATYQGGQRSGRGKRKAPARPTASKPSDKRTNLPGGRSKPKPKPNAQYVQFGGKRVLLHQPHPSGVMVGQRQGPPVPARLANSPKPANLSKPTPKPKPSSATTPTRSSAPARSSAAASRPAATPAKAKPPAASKPTVAQTSGIGPLKSGAAYANRKGSISESVRQLREMREASKRRQTGQFAPALSSSKDYSSQFKDMKGGSSRFASELKKKKKPKK